MKTKDTEYLYATTRIRSLERTLLNHERMERMLEAKSIDELTKILGEMGFNISGTSPHDIEIAIAKSREETFQLIYDLSPIHELVDVFRLRYDYHNIKSLLKSEAMGVDAEKLLIHAGRFSVHAMQSMIRQMEYRDMSPIMRDAVEKSRELLARTNDPQLADFSLDHAYFKEMRFAAERSESTFLIGYVRLLIDVFNLRALVRATRQNKGADFLRSALIAGGNVDTSRFISATGGEATLKDLFAGSSLEAAAEAGALAISGEAGFTRFERLCDNVLMSYLNSAHYVAFGDAPLIAYLAAKESDITAIRIIMAGKLQDLPAEEIRERMRTSYV